MSNEVFPTLPGLAWSFGKHPEMNTKVQRSVNLSELRASFAATPIYHFMLTYDVLRQTGAYAELNTLMGFFNARFGAWDSFLMTDPDDNAATLQVFGYGDASTTTFQLVRTLGSFTEKVSNLNGVPQIYKNNVLVPDTDYTISSTGLVTFDSAPAADAALAWTGSYYFRCRFKEDMQQFDQFMRKLWELQQVELIGSLGTKI